MIKRTMTGIVITAVVYFVIAYSHIQPVISVATAALSAVAVLEIFHATGKCRNKGQKNGCAIAAIVLTFLPIPQYERLLYILFPDISTTWANGMILLCAAVLLLSMVKYLTFHCRLLRSKEK